MAMRKTGKLPTRTTKPGNGPTQKQAPVVGYGVKGGAFHDPAKFKASKAGHKAGGHMPVGGGNQQSHLSPSAKVHYSVAEVSKPTPTASTPRAMAPKSVVRAPRMK